MIIEVEQWGDLLKGQSLKDLHYLKIKLDKLIAHQEQLLSHATPLAAKETELIQASKTIQAIKLIRARTGLSLKDAFYLATIHDC